MFAQPSHRIASVDIATVTAGPLFDRQRSAVNDTLPAPGDTVTTAGNRRTLRPDTTDSRQNTAAPLVFRGKEGWRLLSGPASGTRLETLFRGLRVGGIPGSTEMNREFPTIYFWDEAAGALRSPASMADRMVRGRGYLVYAFEDEDPATPGVQGGFPKTLRPDTSDNRASVPVAIRSTDRNGNEVIDYDEGWNLLGNPFHTEISVAAVLEAVEDGVRPEDSEAVVNRYLYVWDPPDNDGAGAWRTLDAESGDSIGPYEAFWVRVSAPDLPENFSVTFSRDKLKAETRGRNRPVAAEFTPFTLNLGNGSASDAYQIGLHAEALPGPDRLDRQKLFSMDPDAIQLYSYHPAQRTSGDMLPQEMESVVEIPLLFEVSESGTYTFSWSREALSDFPNDWEFKLIDREMDREIDVRFVDSYKFSVQRPAAETTQQLPDPVRERSVASEPSEPRFVLSVNPGTGAQQETALPESVTLKANYPNPFTASTTIMFELAEEMPVQLSVFTIVGQKVATLVEGVRGPGEHPEVWNAANMPSGIYIAQLEAGGQVYIRKMTLVK